MAPPLPHIPILRMGNAYRSLDTRPLRDLGTGQTIAHLSIGNAGLIRRDARHLSAARAALARPTCRDLIDRCAQAGRLFLENTLPLGEHHVQSPDDYTRQLSATSGLPHALVRANMAKIHDALTHLDDILRGLTRGLPPEVIDRGLADADGLALSFFPTTDALGVVMPGNSPGVNALWLPAIALKTPVLLRPGSEEPWTPYRLMQAMLAAGIPAEALGFYPTGHDGTDAVLHTCDRSILFGGADTVRRHAGDRRVEVHGPGWSKVLLGPDTVDRWEAHLDVLVDSIAANSGRSCINASTLVVPSHGDAIAAALADRLAAITPRPADDPDARLSAIANPAVATWVDGQITTHLRTAGATDLTAARRPDPARLVTFEGRTYLLPTLIRCTDPAHPLARTEYMFPYAAVVEVPPEQLVEALGDSLVVTAITDDPDLLDTLIRSRRIHRLNLGPMPTATAYWDQPHEGNLFDLLHQRRAIQRATVAGSGA